LETGTADEPAERAGELAAERWIGSALERFAEHGRAAPARSRRHG